MRKLIREHPVAIGLAVLMHVLLLGLLIVKFDADRDLSGGEVVDPIQSTLIVSRQQQADLAKQAQEREQALAAEREREELEQQRREEQERLEQEIREKEEKLKAQQEEIERQEAIRKQQEIDARKLEEEKRREEEEARKQAELEEQKRVEAEKQEKERLRKEAEAKAEAEQEAERKRLAEIEAEKKRQAEEAAQQARADALAAELAAEESRLQAQRVASLRGQYMFAIKQRVMSKWFPVEGLTGQRCRIAVIQAPNGTVLDVKSQASASCTEKMRESVERAVYRADPLPEAPSREVFERNIVFNFCSPDIEEEAC